MSFKSSNKSIILSVLLSASFGVGATSVDSGQSGDFVSWSVYGNNYFIDKIGLTITGPDGSTTSQASCDSNPVICELSFNGASGNFDTSSLSAGSYSWQLNITPLTDDQACDSSEIRDLMGGYQGLTGGSAPNYEQLYLQCLQNNGLLPPDPSELTASGSFNVAASGLIVPDDGNTTPNDNATPIALCQDVTVEGSSSACLVSADINDGSTDTDGQLVSLVQDPAGPYGLGETLVTLTVTDDGGASASCSAVVTVTDSEAPTVECPTDNTMSPNTAPMTFTASTNDSCGVPATQVVSYDCYRFNPRGKRIDTNDSCVVDVAADGITVVETSGVNSFIDWTIESTDSSGNSSSATCTVEVLHPNGQ